MANFYGIPGIEFISHGEWSDPEIVYENFSFNYWDVEDTLYGIFTEEFEPYDADEELFVSKETGELLSFEDWVKQEKGLVYDELDDIIYGTLNPNEITIDWLIDTDQEDALQQLYDNYMIDELHEYSVFNYHGTEDEKERLRDYYSGTYFSVDDFFSPIRL